MIGAGPPHKLLTLPEGRSWPPTDDELLAAGECNVKGSTAAGCVTKLVREWLSVDCTESPNPPKGIAVTQGGHGDAYVSNQSGGLLIPVLEGDTTRARFGWEKSSRELSLDFPKGGKLTMAFSAPKPSTEAPNTSTSPPNNPLGEVQCARGDRVGGALRRCGRPCDDKTPCTEGGHCEPWPTGGFCALP